MFDISIEQQVLATALEFISSTVDKDTGLGQSCVSMETTGNGSVIMYTGNGNEFTEVEAIVTLGGNTVEKAPYVDFKRLYSIVKTIPKNEVVSIKASVNDLIINFSLKPVPIKLIGVGNGMIPLPSLTNGTSTVATIPTKVITKAVTSACAILTDTNSKNIFDCICINTSSQNVDITAIDVVTKRTFSYSDVCTNNNPTQKFFLEAQKAKNASKIFVDFLDLDITMDNSVICIEGTTQIPYPAHDLITMVKYYSARLNGTFPNNIKQNMLPLPNEYAQLSKQDIIDTITRIKAINNGCVNHVVTLSGTTKSINAMVSSIYGSMEDHIETSNTLSTPIPQNTFNYDSLNDIIKTIQGDVIEIGILPNHTDSLIIKKFGDDSVLYTLPSIIVNTASTP